MEKYQMPDELDLENLRYCLDHFETESLFIRGVGSVIETHPKRVNEDLKGRTLDFRTDDSGLYLTIDDEEIFHFSLKDRGTKSNGFSVFYERFYGDGRMVMLPTGYDPEDPELPEVTSSILKHNWDMYFMEITFKGKIPLEFHSWWHEPHFAYWTVKKTED